MHAIMIGLDLAKPSFQVHGLDAAGKIVVKRKLRRARSSNSSESWSPASSAWRLARRRAIGRAN